MVVQWKQGEWNALPDLALRWVHVMTFSPLGLKLSLGCFKKSIVPYFDSSIFLFSQHLQMINIGQYVILLWAFSAAYGAALWSCKWVFLVSQVEALLKHRSLGQTLFVVIGAYTPNYLHILPISSHSPSPWWSEFIISQSALVSQLHILWPSVSVCQWILWGTGFSLLSISKVFHYFHYIFIFSFHIYSNNFLFFQ